MRALYAAILVSLIPGLAIAQGSRSDPEPTLPSIGLPLPQIGLPLPSIGLPLPSIGLPPAQPRRVDRPINRGNKPPSHRPPPGNGHGSRPSQVIVYPVPVYLAPATGGGGADDEVPPLAAAPAPEPEQPIGTLRLDLQPAADAQLHVDGYFIGTIADMGTELALTPGPHTIDVRADGYEPMTVNVKIDANRTITYRGALQSARGTGAAASAPAAPVAAAVQRGPFYMIPGCYFGNVPPAQAVLPKTCDPSRVVIVRP